MPCANLVRKWLEWVIGAVLSGALLIYSSAVSAQAAVYEININEAVLADLVVFPTLNPQPVETNNGVNPVDIGIFTRISPLVGAAGALWFGTNTSLTAVVNQTSASNIDIAFVEIDPNAGIVAVTVDGNATGLPIARLATFNIYNLTSGVTAQVHNVLAGTVVIQFSGDGQNVVGEINLGGSSGFGGPTVSSVYRGTFTGVRIQ